jgi:hypothetical protein
MEEKINGKRDTLQRKFYIYQWLYNNLIVICLVCIILNILKTQSIIDFLKILYVPNLLNFLNIIQKKLKAISNIIVISTYIFSYLLILIVYFRYKTQGINPLFSYTNQYIFIQKDKLKIYRNFNRYYFIIKSFNDIIEENLTQFSFKTNYRINIIYDNNNNFIILNDKAKKNKKIHNIFFPLDKNKKFTPYALRKLEIFFEVLALTKKIYINNNYIKMHYDKIFPISDDFIDNLVGLSYIDKNVSSDDFL